MARLITGLILMVCCLFIAMPNDGYARKLQSENPWFQYICRGTEKFAKIHFYLQDVLAGPNQTVYEVARASITANSSTMFGLVEAYDDLMTVGPDRNSKKLGRAQGLLAFSDLKTFAYVTNMNFLFTFGKYNGSTISIVGRNQFNEVERELAIIGGTGLFRYARGHVIATTYSSDTKIGYNVLGYTIYVSHADGHGRC